MKKRRSRMLNAGFQLLCCSLRNLALLRFKQCAKRKHHDERKFKEQTVNRICELFGGIFRCVQRNAGRVNASRGCRADRS